MSSLALVGDRHRLRERQRLAVARAACADEARERRARTRLPLEAITGRVLGVDGFNLLITLEAALGGGVILRGRDGCLRDMSSVHGSYRAVAETERALVLVGETLAPLGPLSVRWLLDRPVSNSGRLAQRIREVGDERGWPWTVEAVFSPDKLLRETDEVVVSSDANILDAAARWVNLADHIISEQLPQTWLLDLSG